MVSIESRFTFAKIPRIEFGEGKYREIPEIIAGMKGNILFILSRSFAAAKYYCEIKDGLKKNNLEWWEIFVSGEPSPELVDDTVLKFKDRNIGVVVSIGGGSTIDYGKAVSAMLLEKGSVVDYLEGVGTKAHSGIKVPFIAVPTSAGTGSEATKNAVLSRVGENGFKKSLRHDNFVPDVAVVDPLLSVSCPKNITAACGLDALTQLLESYTSTNSSPMTDALAESGLKHIKEGFISAFLDGNDLKARSHMAYAAMISGITLANAGLGVVHGLASPIGGYFKIPHGVVCGTLLGEATRMNIEVLLKEPEQNKVYLEKYAKAGEILSGKEFKNIENGCRLLVETLDKWIDITGIPTLNNYSITKEDIHRIVKAASCKNNPAKLSSEQIASIIQNRIS